MGELAHVEGEEGPEGLVIRIDGEIDLSNVETVGAAVEGLIPNSASNVVVDLVGVRYLDSSALRLLFRLAERLKARRQDLRLRVPEDSPVRAAVEVSRLPDAAPLV